MEKARYMISDAATMAGVESHVLRYWEDELELTIPRNEMGHRYYTRENIQEFQKIKELKEQGYQLKAIRMILHNGGAIPPDVRPVEASAAPRTSPAISIVPHPSAAAAAAAAASASGKQQNFNTVQDAPQPAARTQPQNFSAAPAQSVPVQTQTQEFTIAPQPVSAPAADYAVATHPQAAINPAAQPVPLSAEERMAQFRELMSDIVGHAIEQNNEELSLNISQEVRETVLKEMNYLFREQEEAQEDRYKKLDATIRGNLQRKKSLFAAKDKPPKEKKEKRRGADKKAADKKTTASI